MSSAPLDPLLAATEEYEERIRFFSNFLHSNREEWEKIIARELINGSHRIPLDLQKLDKDHPGLANQLLKSPVKYILPWEEALLSFYMDANEKAAKNLRQPLKLSPHGSFGRNHVTPRGVTSGTLHQLMCVEGMVVKCSPKQPKLVQSIHTRTNEDGRVIGRDHRDATAFVDAPMAGALPNKDGEGFDLQLEIGLSTYKDQQKFMLQESPEHAPAGQIPRSIEVICDGDLCDKAKPGDRVQVVGVYRGFPGMLSEVTTGVWPARLIATNITQTKELDDSPFVPQDLNNIKMIANRPDCFEILARSFAPSICGHERVKAGLLLQLIGGTEKNLDNGTHLRGDINVLMVGDPSCGKSQMLRFVMNIAPLAISTTGRGSSGVGLTAAMVRDPGSRDFTIEAGAMVLADRGYICIDEFDKMGQGDRVAIHEAMEQQCVTIAKAGMHVTLNARCSVVAAANPIYGTFDPTLDLAKNIGMPDSLLSRFDLIFVVRDLTNEEIDRKIATQVLNQARQRISESGCRGVEAVHSSILERHREVNAKSNQEPSKLFERRGEAEGGKEEVLTVDFLSKYIRYCKRFTPVLTEEAQDKIATKYVEMRERFVGGGQKDKPKLAVTTRTLEALIRLSTAHAKLKLRKEDVLPEDVEEAYKLMLAAREEEPPKPISPAIMAVAGDGPDGPDAPAGGSRKRGAGGEGGVGAPAKRAKALSEQRFRIFGTLVGRTFARMQMLAELSQEDLLVNINGELSAGEDPFTEEELRAGIARLEMANKVFVSETGEISLIG